MDWKKILSLGALVGFAWFVYRGASAQGRSTTTTSARYLDEPMNPIAANALGLAPLESPVYQPFAFDFRPSRPLSPAVPMPVGRSGLYEGMYAPKDLSTLEAR